MNTSKPTTPCHLIAGPLGVGKTTAILDYLRHKKDSEHIAVLVNDFGANGLDGVVLTSEGAPLAGELDVIAVPGGCLCCTSSIYFDEHLQKLANAEAVDRIIIEPSGMILLDQMKALLRQVGEKTPLDIRPVILLLNAARFNQQLYSEMPYYQTLIREADILVANRCDQASDEQIQRFCSWADTLRPAPQLILTTTRGQLPPQAFDPGPASDHPLAAHPHHHAKDHQTGSRQWPAPACFDFDRLMAALGATVRNDPDQDLQRLKAILHTTRGWQLIEVAQGNLSARPFPEQTTNQIDWITSSGKAASAGMEEGFRAMEACRV